MFTFSKRSKEEMKHLHADNIALLNEGIKYYDIVVVDGSRTLAEQIKYVQKGVSKTLHSLHLRQADGKAWAMDLLPWPDFSYVDADKAVRDLLMFGGFMMGLAATLGLSFRYGGDWDRDRRNSNNKFQDLGHFERYVA